MVPGNPIWHLAPREMAWEGKTVGEICAQIKDPARNGGRSLASLVEHIGEDHLVGWAWAPGMRPHASARHAKASGRARRGVGRERRGVPRALTRQRRKRFDPHSALQLGVRARLPSTSS